MLAAVSFWTLASASHAFAAGFLGFAIARAALGFGEGATFPGGLRAVTQTLQPSQYARGIALAYSGGSLGAIVTPLLLTPIAVWWGWRVGFLFTGAVGLAWISLWLIVSRRPDVRAFRPPRAADAGGAKPSLKDPRVWGFMLSYALGGLPIGFVMYGAAIYLDQLGKTQIEIGKVLWIPPLGWELGYFAWGTLCDRMCRGSSNPLAILRRLMAAAAVLSLPLALTPVLPWFPLVLLEMFFAMFVAAGFVILSLGHATRIFSPSYSGLIAGLGAGTWSAVVALTMPLFGRLFDLHRHDLAFLLASLVPPMGFAAWVWANRVKAGARQVAAAGAVRSE
jgi:ACS family hexuronate transporter-like MFS transporter